MVARAKPIMKVALYSTAAGSVAATGVACLQWLALAAYFSAPPHEVSIVQGVGIVVLTLWAGFFVFMHYLLLMIVAGLPVLLVVAWLRAGNLFVALAAGSLLTTTASMAYFSVVTSEAMGGIVGLSAYQVLPGAAAGLAVWLACRQVLTPRPARPS